MTLHPCSFVLCPKAVVVCEELMESSAGSVEVSNGVPCLVAFEVVDDELE